MKSMCDQAMPACREGGRNLQKCSKSSRGWESLPAKATARQVGNEPCDASGDAGGDA